MKRTMSIPVALILALSLILPVSVSATLPPPLSTGTYVVDCTAVQFTGTVATGEIVRLEVRLHSGPSWMDPVVQNDYIQVTTPGAFNVTVPWIESPDGKLNRVAIAISNDNGASWFTYANQEGMLSCPPPPPPGNEGCTPGYWRNHLEDWPPTGYATTDDFDATFGVDLFTPNITLGRAIWLGGGGLNKLARHGTAALLSAAHSDVAYPYSVAQVIAYVQAGNADVLAAANELGCSIP